MTSPLRSTLVLTLAAAALALAGCSSTPKTKDSGPIRAGTFRFVDPVDRPLAAGNAAERKTIHGFVQDAITHSLAAHGIQPAPTPGSPDVLVAYLIIVGNNVTTVAVDDYFGLGRNAAALESKAHEAYMASKNPNLFEAGTLVVDLIDARTFDLLRRRHVTRPTLGDVSDDARRAHIAGAVDELFSDLRVAAP